MARELPITARTGSKLFGVKSMPPAEQAFGRALPLLFGLSAQHKECV